MIVLSKDKIIKDYFIDQNSVITDKNGNVQKQYLDRGRYWFKQQFVHKIMLNTFVGVKDKNFVVHHLDENPLNNKLSNLIYLTRKEHTHLHHKGKHRSAESRAKMRAAKMGLKFFNNGIK